MRLRGRCNSAWVVDDDSFVSKIEFRVAGHEITC